MRTWCAIDLETLSLKQSTCPILSLGAVSYSFEEGITAEFHEFFNVDEQFKLGRLPQWKTIQWWLKQSDDARTPMSGERKDTLTVDEMTDEFYEWWDEEVGTPAQHWAEDFDYKLGARAISNGSNFDIAILESLFDEVPWHFRNTRCYRSMIDWFPAPVQPRQTIKHDALQDAIYQAKVHLNLMVSNENLR